MVRSTHDASKKPCVSRDRERESLDEAYFECTPHLSSIKLVPPGFFPFLSQLLQHD